MKKMKIHTRCSLYIVTFCCVLNLAASHPSVACSYQYADYRDDAPDSPCSEENNDPVMYNFVECSYSATLAPFFCRTTTASVDCTGYTSPLTGTEATCNAYVNTMAGWCVNGVCNYNVVMVAQSDWFQDRPMMTTVECSGG